MNPTRLHAVTAPRPLLVDAGGPVFLLGDTAWELFHRASREEIGFYLQTRARQGFRCVWVAALAEFDGLRAPNREGHLPFADLDPARPSEAYWELLDWTLDRAGEVGLSLGLLPTWGDKVTPMWGEGPVVFARERPEIAEAYGAWLGARYRERENLFWVLGGDRPPTNDGVDYRPVWRAMAAGLDRGEGRRRLKLYHPNGGPRGTSPDLQGEAWLDAHAFQSGHGQGRDAPGWDVVARDLALPDPKPSFDAEPNYEDHPVDPWPEWDPAKGYFDDHDARKAAWRTAFAGACGVTYGHHSVWQWAGKDPEAWINHARMPWREALDRPGAVGMGHLRRFLEGRGFAAMHPDGGSGEGASYSPRMRGEGRMWVYLPKRATVAPGFAAIRANWYDPRTGETVGAAAGESYSSPAGGPDWVLELFA